jgi:hypothetical protein
VDGLIEQAVERRRHDSSRAAVQAFGSSTGWSESDAGRMPQHRDLPQERSPRNYWNVESCREFSSACRIGVICGRAM